MVHCSVSTNPTEEKPHMHNLCELLIIGKAASLHATLINSSYYPICLFFYQPISTPSTKYEWIQMHNYLHAAVGTSGLYLTELRPSVSVYHPNY